jgi:cytochrome c oxidase assembly protein subunit 15
MPAQAPACIRRQETAGPWVHRLAVLTAGMTFVLMLVGGLVTVTGSALAVPDWPTTFGYNMFLYPWSKMVGGIFYEHTHRLIGSVVGLLTLTLALALWIREPRRWLGRLGIVACIAVIAQGVLGGLRVIHLSAGTTIAIVHGCLAQAFFALTVGLALFTSRGWLREPEPIGGVDVGPVKRLALVTTGLLFVQIVFGAILTHSGRLLMTHLLAAGLVTVHVTVMAGRILRHDPYRVGLARPAIALFALTLLQLLLGLGSYVGRYTALDFPRATLVGLAIPVAHRLTGALMLATCLILTLRAHRWSVSSATLAGREIAPEGMAA